MWEVMIMKKMKRLISTIIAGMMSVSLLGSLSVIAEEEKVYTFSELLEMSEEEFFEKNDAYVYRYEYLKDQGIKYKSILCSFYTDTFYDEYVPYETEKKLYKLFENCGEELYILSPITLTLPPDIPYYYSNLMFINFEKELKFNSEVELNEAALYVTKMECCVNQIMHFSYNAIDEILSSKPIAYGEANGDDKLTAADAAYIARKLAEQKADELPETADFNNDGEVTALDCAKIAQFLAARSMAQAEGMIEQY